MFVTCLPLKNNNCDTYVHAICSMLLVPITWNFLQMKKPAGGV